MLSVLEQIGVSNYRIAKHTEWFKSFDAKLNAKLDLSSFKALTLN